MSLFEFEIGKIRANFELCSNRLRADFEELHRMERELKASNRCAKSEVAYWKRGYDSEV